LRGEVKFDGLEGLKAQLLQDKNKATTLLKSN
jgi:FAD synthase